MPSAVDMPAASEAMVRVGRLWLSARSTSTAAPSSRSTSSERVSTRRMDGAEPSKSDAGRSAPGPGRAAASSKGVARSTWPLRHPSRDVPDRESGAARCRWARALSSKDGAEEPLRCSRPLAASPRERAASSLRRVLSSGCSALSPRHSAPVSGSASHGPATCQARCMLPSAACRGPKLRCIACGNRAECGPPSMARTTLGTGSRPSTSIGAVENASVSMACALT